MRLPEILAPAGSIESMYAALRFADAVYVGGSRFGARAFASNPSVEELKKALIYAHLRGKKIYLTVNTLLSDEDFDELSALVSPLYEYGLDACIVQDMGVLSFLYENFPEMALHASTQMTLFSGEEANLLRPYGVTRYVPARELTIEEICRAGKETEMEIEVFVHGALCYCYSGQCLMSEAIGGRSGNKGMCAQPCRLPWRLSGLGDSHEGQTGHFLSTKDICTLTDIPVLVDAGIDSFKIEGRMKKKEYSAYTAYLYRKYTDFYLSHGRGAFQKLREDPESDLWRDFRRCQDVYNRGGFSRGFLFGKEDMICFTRNGHFGTCLGKVEKTGKDAEGKRTAVFSAGEPLAAQDILEFRDRNDRKIYEYTVKSASEKGKSVTAKIGNSPVLTGQSVYRTRNAKLLSYIDEMIEQKGDKIPLAGEFEGELGSPCRFMVRGAGVAAVVQGAVVSRAEKHPVTEKDIRAGLDRLGDTDYVFDRLDIRMAENGFLPLGGLKKLRRDALAAWEEKAVPRRQTPGNDRRLTGGAVCDEKKTQGQFTELPCFSGMISVSTCAQAQIVREKMREDILLHVDLTDIPGSEWPGLADTLRGCRAALSLPQILRGRSREVFEAEWDRWGEYLRELSLEAVVINSFAAFIHARKYWDTPFLAESSLYMENRRAREVYEGWGIYPAPDIVLGRRQVMVTENCILRTIGSCGKKKKPFVICTPKGDEFLVVNHCMYCYNTIYTKESITTSGKCGTRLVFTLEKEEEIRKGMRAWNLS